MLDPKAGSLDPAQPAGGEEKSELGTPKGKKAVYKTDA